MDLQHPEPEDLLCDESFQRFCQGELPDTLFWENWIDSHPDHAATVKKAMWMFDMLNAGQGSREEQLFAMKDALTRRERFAKIIGSNTAKVTRLRSRNFIKYAAAVTLLISTATLAYMKYGRDDKSSDLLTLHNYDYYTTANNRKTVVLPDSSVIMLNRNSHLSISKNFDSEHREVTITGEAFFDIKQDEEHPFIVHTSEYRIRVLGTTFNVKSYPGGNITETDLLTGKVEIVSNTSHHTKDRVILKPNEKFVLERGPVINAVQGATVPPVAAPVKGMVAKLKLDTLTRHITETAWARQKMEINDETFDQIAKKLEAWYGIKVIFTSEAVKKYRYTASFNDETIFKALQYLQQSYPFNYRIEQDAIVISQS